MKPPERLLVLYIPSWPVLATARERKLDPQGPLAISYRGEIAACSPQAQDHGIHPGQRLREAQARCPELKIASRDQNLISRQFEPVLHAVEKLVPAIHPYRPGICSLRALGPARYYGGESTAARTILNALTETLPELTAVAGFEARIGIADGTFAAERAAEQAEPGQALAVPVGHSPAFLAALGLEAVQDPQLEAMLHDLGLSRLGDLAALEPHRVRDRFGPQGVRAQLLARGEEVRAFIPRTPPSPPHAELDFDPPVERADQLSFAFRASAERFVDQLSAAGLVCTELRLRISDADGRVLNRTWKHPRFFSAEDIIDRLRWQLTEVHGLLGSAVAQIIAEPEQTADLSDHRQGLWGNGPEEQLHHGLARIQGMLGHTSVLTARLRGGRLLARRQSLVPWGDAPKASAAELKQERSRPWPGALSGPAPATLFSTPLAAQLLSVTGQSITVDERLTVSQPPAFFIPPADPQNRSPQSQSMSAPVPKPPRPAPRAVLAWAGPWPIEERWWNSSGVRCYRFQITEETGEAWSLLCTETGWLAEARYD